MKNISKMRSARHQTDHPSMMIHYNKIISHSFCFFSVLYDDIRYIKYLLSRLYFAWLPLSGQPFFLSSFLPRNLDNRNITVEEAEAVNELHLYRETLESSPNRLKGLNSFHDFRKSIGRTYSNHRKPFSFFDNLYGMFCLAFLVY